MKPSSQPPRVGEALVSEGVITNEELETALAVQRRSGRLLGEVLVEEGVVPAGVLIRALANRLGVKGCQLRHGMIDPALLKLIGAEEAERLKVIPMFRVCDTLTLAMAEPQSLPTIDRVRSLTGCKIRPVLALESNIMEFVRKYAAGAVAVNSFLASLSESNVQVIEKESIDDDTATDLDKMVEGSPIVTLINVALLTSIKAGASDIHIEPTNRGTRMRQRIDGVLRELMNPPPGMHSAIVSRVKVIGKMDIGERRLPQEGRVHIVAEGREIDLRVSSMPTLLGEKLVIRILDKDNLKVQLSDLGMRVRSLESVRRVLARPYGLLMVTGPTGSGKTTTLYSAIDLLRGPTRNIVTAEDPVEYRLDYVNQVQVQESIGLTFARVLRSLLRQDPDVMMVGEVRDQETARVAIQAALTGHVVLATLHTNDAPGAIARLVDMGIESYLISGALQGVVAQRLARMICPACATNYYPVEQVLIDAGLDPAEGRSFRKGEGCRQCHDSGFQGRLGIFEVMEVDGRMRQLIHAGEPTHALRQVLRRSGVYSLRREGVEHALEGKTSLEEVLRVTSIEDDQSCADDQADTGGAAA